MHSSAAAIDGSFSCTRSLASRPVDPLTVGRQCSEEYSTSAFGPLLLFRVWVGLQATSHVADVHADAYVCDCFQSLNATWSALLSVAIVNGKRSLRAVVLRNQLTIGVAYSPAHNMESQRQRHRETGRRAGGRVGRQARRQAEALQ